MIEGDVHIRKMTLNEAIGLCDQNAFCNGKYHIDNAQLSDWLKELKGFRDAEIIKKAAEDSRMEFIKDKKKKKIAESLFDYARIDNNETVVVPMFRVLDALIQDGESYSEG
jgi:hypothetical protein